MQQHLVLTVQEAREWTRIDADADTNLLQNLIFAVQEHAAQYLGRRLDPIDCPRPVKHAIAVMVADMYANREGKLVGTRTFEALLAPYRAAYL